MIITPIVIKLDKPEQGYSLLGPAAAISAVFGMMVGLIGFVSEKICGDCPNNSVENPVVLNC